MQTGSSLYSAKLYATALAAHTQKSSSMTYPISSHPAGLASHPCQPPYTTGSTCTAHPLNPHDMTAPTAPNYPNASTIPGPAASTSASAPNHLRPTHLRTASHSSVSSSSSNHARHPSHTFTPTLQAIPALPSSSSPALQQVQYPVGMYGCGHSPSLQTQHPSQPPTQSRPQTQHLSPLSHDPHGAGHTSVPTSVPMARTYHPNVPAVPTPLKRSYSDIGLHHQHSTPRYHSAQHAFLHQPAVLPYQYSATPPHYNYSQIPSAYAQPSQQGMYSSPSHPLQLFAPTDYTPIGPETSYLFPNPPVNAPVAGFPTSASPSTHFPQAHLAESPVYPEIGPGRADSAEEHETQVQAEQEEPVSRAASPSPSIAESAVSSYSQRRGASAGRGGRGRGGARGGGTKRKGSGWTKRKPSSTVTALASQRQGGGRGNKGGRASDAAEKENIAPEASFTQTWNGNNLSADFSTSYPNENPYACAAPPPESHPFSADTAAKPSGFDADSTIDPSLAAAAGIPPEIAIYLRNLQPGPLILPPPGCGLQISNLLIHVPAAMSDVKKVQEESKKWCHIIDPSGAPVMLDGIRPHVHEQYTCRCCRKTYTGKNARSVARRHLQDKHGVPLVLQERRSRWDKSTGQAPMDRAEAHEREKKSKRESAKRSRELQRQAKANIAAAAQGDETIYSPPISRSGPSAKVSRGSAANSRSRTSLRTSTAAQHPPDAASPRMPVSPEFSLNSEGSPVLVDTRPSRLDTPIEMVQDAHLTGTAATHVQPVYHPSVPGASAPILNMSMPSSETHEPPFEQTRRLLATHGMSEHDIARYYHHFMSGYGSFPAAQSGPPAWAEAGQATQSLGPGCNLPFASAMSGPSDPYRNMQGHRRSVSQISSASDSSWVYLESETPDYVQMRDKQTWVVPPPSVAPASLSGTAVHAAAEVGLGYSPGQGAGAGMGMSMNVGTGISKATDHAPTATGDADDAELAAAGLMEMSSPIKGGQPAKKKVKRMAMRRANTIAIPAAAQGIPSGWPGLVDAQADVQPCLSLHLNGEDRARSGPGLSINTQATSSTTIEPAPLSAPASGNAASFFPSSHPYSLSFLQPTIPGASNPIVAPDYHPPGPESPLAYMNRSLSHAGPIRPLPRQPFAKGRAQLARSISLSLPKTGSPLGADDFDVFAQSLGGEKSGDTGDQDTRTAERDAQGEGAQILSAPTAGRHGRTQSSGILQPISERTQSTTHVNDEPRKADAAKNRPKVSMSATATGSPVTRSRKLALGGGVGMKRKFSGANARFMLGMAATSETARSDTPADEATHREGKGGTGLGAAAVGANGKSATSPPHRSFNLSYGSTSTAHAKPNNSLALSSSAPARSPMFKLAANSFKTPLKQRDLNAPAAGNDRLVPPGGEVDGLAKYDLITPAPPARLLYASAPGQSGTATTDVNGKALQSLLSDSNREPHIRSGTFEPYSTDPASSTARPGTSTSTSLSGDSMLTSLAPSHTTTPLPRRTQYGGGGGSKGTAGGAPASVTRNWADLSSPAHAGLAHQLGLGLTSDTPGGAWRTPVVLRGLRQFETPGMVDADAEWDDEGM